MKIAKNDICFVFAVLFALLFMLTGVFWIYWFALIFAYPLGIISLLIWFSIKKDCRKRNKLIPLMLIIGFVLSVSMLLPWIMNK